MRIRYRTRPSRHAIIKSAKLFAGGSRRLFMRSKSVTSQKHSIREEAKRHRDRLDHNHQDSLDAVGHFFTKFNPQAGTRIALYWPKGREFDTLALVDKIFESECVCLLPVVKKDSRVLDFYSWDGKSDLVKGAFDIAQPILTPQSLPQIPDIIVIPLLAFDRRGHRLGYGGGYYDATLTHLRKTSAIQAVGWAYAEQAVLFNLPADEHDQALDFVVTPKGVHSFLK